MVQRSEMLKSRSLLIAVLALAVGAFGSAHSEQPKSAGQGPTPQTRQGIPAPEAKEQSPISVKIISTPETKDETLQERARRLAHESNEQDLADFTRILAYTTIGLAIIAVAQACLFVWQLVYMRASIRDTKKAADAASDSSETAKQAMITGQRAYVHHNGFRWFSHLDNADGTYFWSIRPQWINRGNTPTRKGTVYVHWEFIDHALPDDYLFTMDSTVVLSPANLAPQTPIQSGYLKVEAEDLVRVSKKEKHLYIWGVARYRDVFQDTPEHITKFCVYASEITGNPLEPYDAQKNPLEIVFLAYNRHNCADEECI
jgi:hypothetical protein